MEDGKVPSPELPPADAPTPPEPVILPNPFMRIHRKLPAPEPLIPPKYPEEPPLKVITPPTGALAGMPSPKHQQWGAVISIVIIVLMVTIGAFYAWGKRIAQENALIVPVVTE